MHMGGAQGLLIKFSKSPLTLSQQRGYAPVLVGIGFSKKKKLNFYTGHMFADTYRLSPCPHAI